MIKLETHRQCLQQSKEGNRPVLVAAKHASGQTDRQTGKHTCLPCNLFFIQRKQKVISNFLNFQAFDIFDKNEYAYDRDLTSFYTNERNLMKCSTFKIQMFNPEARPIGTT